jgi:hypothetical protein
MVIGTWCATYEDSICIQWNQRKYSKTVQLEPKSSNIGTIWSISGYRKHHKFCAMRAQSVTDWDSDTQCYEIDLSEDTYVEEMPDKFEEKGSVAEPGDEEQTNSTFRINGPYIENQKEIPDSDNDSEELLLWHHKLSLISMKHIQRMSRCGYLPDRLGKCRIPLCQSCLYGKQTRRPWRTKPFKEQLKIIKCNESGDCVSVDQLESSTLGLIGQMKGRLTKSRYRVATVFADHYSNFGYVYLQTSTNSNETVRAKNEFEKYARTCGVNIKHYHADNGRFSDNLWREDILTKGQRLTFCDVGAHHQNGRAEKSIRDAQDHARTSLIHANRRWPEAIDSRLWSYALRQAIDAINKTPFPSSQDGETPYCLRNKISLPHLW